MLVSVTTSGGPTAAEQLEGLRAVLQAKAAQMAAAAEKRDRLRSELRSVERDLQGLDGQVKALTQLVAEYEPPEAGRVTSIHGRGGESELVPPTSLKGMPRVHAVEAILAKAGDRPIHRTDIWAAMKNGGFPSETLTDTSAGLAYLKRIGHAFNPARGYWRLSETSSRTA